MTDWKPVSIVVYSIVNQQEPKGNQSQRLFAKMGVNVVIKRLKRHGKV